MANPDQLQTLYQGIEVWNRWREENSDIEPDLSFADLSEEDLRDANFSSAKLSGADLSLSNLRGANFNCADLDGVRFYDADLRGTDFSYAYLMNTNFQSALLGDADFTCAFFARNNFSDNDLSEVSGLQDVSCAGPSSIGIDTIYKSGGSIPEEFLRRCGVPGEFITYMRSLTGKAIEFYSCFISYSSKDEEFAKRLYNDLQSEGVRCWFAPEDLRIGEKFRVRIDESIRLYDKLLLVLSENSVSSQWVEKEVETAFEKEGEQGKTVLFPVMLDDAVLEAKTGWAADVRRSRHVGDFRDWKNHDSYRKAFERLMRDLKAEAGR